MERIEELVLTRPFDGILPLVNKFKTMGLAFTDKKVRIDNNILADFAKPVLITDLDYIVNNLYKNIKTITYYGTQEPRLIVPKAEEVIFLFEPEYQYSIKALEEKDICIDIYYGLLIFKEPNLDKEELTMYLCLDTKYSNMRKNPYKIFKIFHINKKLISSYAVWHFIMRSTEKQA